MNTEDLSPEEQKQLDTFMSTDNTVPPADAQEGAPAPDPAAAPAPSPAPAPAPAPAPTPEPAPAPAPDAPTGQAPAGEQTEDERFAAWKAQHAGKTPEEIERLAFQQSQRASGAEARARTSQQSLQQIQDRVRTASETAAAARKAVTDRAAAFKETLANDPDAAALAIREEADAAELARIDAVEHQARVDAAVGLASQALPDFHERATGIYDFGGEMGYSQEELAGISDGRDLVVLGLAEMSARLIKGGMMDMKGNLLAATPQPVADTPTDPRLAAPTPHATLSSAPARPAATGKGVVQQATDLLSMSDADFSKFAAEHPAEFDRMMRQLEGAS